MKSWSDFFYYTPKIKEFVYVRNFILYLPGWYSWGNERWGGKKIKVYRHLQEFILRINILLGDNSPWVSCVFACLTSRGSESLYSQLCFQGYMYSTPSEEKNIVVLLSKRQVYLQFCKVHVVAPSWENSMHAFYPL